MSAKPLKLPAQHDIVDLPACLYFKKLYQVALEPNCLINALQLTSNPVTRAPIPGYV